MVTIANLKAAGQERLNERYGTPAACTAGMLCAAPQISDALLPRAQNESIHTALAASAL